MRCAILLAALLTIASGCVSQPIATLHSVRVQSVSPMGLGLEMVMKVRNENVFDVQVRDVRASVVVAEKFRLPPLVYNPNQWLPAGRSTLVRVPVMMPWPLVGPMVAYTVGSDTISYEVDGWVDVTAVRMLGIQKNNHKFEDVGEMSRMQIVQAAFRGMGPGMPSRPY